MERLVELVFCTTGQVMKLDFKRECVFMHMQCHMRVYMAPLTKIMRLCEILCLCKMLKVGVHLSGLNIWVGQKAYFQKYFIRLM